MQRDEAMAGFRAALALLHRDATSAGGYDRVAFSKRLGWDINGNPMVILHADGTYALCAVETCTETEGPELLKLDWPPEGLFRQRAAALAAELEAALVPPAGLFGGTTP